MLILAFGWSGTLTLALYFAPPTIVAQLENDSANAANERKTNKSLFIFKLAQFYPIGRVGF